MARTKLVLITSGFPFGHTEPFLETEIRYLSEGFEHVHIVAVDPVSNEIRTLPANCSVAAVRTTSGLVAKLRALSQLCNPRIWEEWRIVRSTYKLPFSFGVCKTMLMSMQRAKQLAKALQPYIDKPEHTVCYSYWCDDAALALSILKEELPEVKVVSRAHGWDVYFEVHAVNYLPFRHFIVRQLDSVFPIAKKGRRYMLEKWQVPDDAKIQVARLGVVQQQPVQPNENFILVSCSNMIPLKRIHLIIEALSLLEEKEVTWVHFGDGAECEKLLELAGNILKPNIQWVFKGHEPNQRVLEWYAEHNPTVFINVSSSEGIPVSIMEAMSFGIPVIATDVGGTGEIVNETNGILLSENPSAREIADAMNMFFLNTVLMEKREQALLTWGGDYNASVNYVQFVNMLQNPSQPL